MQCDYKSLKEHQWINEFLYLSVLIRGVGIRAPFFLVFLTVFAVTIRFEPREIETNRFKP